MPAESLTVLLTATWTNNDCRTYKQAFSVKSNGTNQLFTSRFVLVVFALTILKNTNSLSCTRLRILLNTICRKPGFNSLRTPLNHGAGQASNETLKQTQQRNWSNASQGGQTALKEHFAVLHYETASTTQQPRGEHRSTIKDCKIAGATTWQGQGNHTFTTILPAKFRVRYDKR